MLSQLWFDSTERANFSAKLNLPNLINADLFYCTKGYRVDIKRFFFPEHPNMVKKNQADLSFMFCWSCC